MLCFCDLFVHVIGWSVLHQGFSHLWIRVVRSNASGRGLVGKDVYRRRVLEFILKREK